jgi:hypothetical protein
MGFARDEFAWEFLKQWSTLTNISHNESADIIVMVHIKYARSQNIKKYFI